MKKRVVFICIFLLMFLGSKAQLPVYSGWTVWGGGVSTISIEPRSGTDLWLKVTSSHCAHGTHQYFNTVAGTSYTIGFDLDLGTTSKVNLLVWDVTPGGTLYNLRVVSYTAGGNGLNQTFLAGDTRALIQFRQDTCTGTHSFYLDKIDIWAISMTHVVAAAPLDMGYRYGFNGQEKNNEWSGNGNNYNFGERIYDSRIGIFLSGDPLSLEHPWQTPYSFSADSPIGMVDVDGLDPHPSGRKLDKTQKHFKFEYRQTTTASGNVIYERRKHFYNMNRVPDANETAWKTITSTNYAHGQKWGYVDNEPNTQKELTIKGTEQSGNGTYTREYNVDGARSISGKIQFDMYGHADQITIEYYDPASDTWNRIKSSGFATENGELEIPTTSLPENSRLRITVTPQNNWEGSKFDFSGKISLSETTDGGTYSSDWNDNWNNDFEFDPLQVPGHYESKPNSKRSKNNLYGTQSHDSGSYGP